MAYTESPRAVTNGRIRTLPLVGLGANPIRRSQILPGSESSRAPGGALECFLTGTPPEIPEIRTPLLYPRNPRSVSCLTRPVLRNRQVIGSSPIAGSRFSTTYHPTPSTPAQSRRYSRCDSATGEVGRVSRSACRSCSSKNPCSPRRGSPGPGPGASLSAASGPTASRPPVVPTRRCCAASCAAE